MTDILTGKFFCKKCKLYFEAQYKHSKRPRKTCQSCHKSCDLVKKKTNEDDNSSIKTFIDDPDELLLSTAIRELNKPHPDPRWATILINCKKENINTKGDVLEQFKQLPTQVLVNLLSKNLQEESE